MKKTVLLAVSDFHRDIYLSELEDMCQMDIVSFTAENLDGLYYLYKALDVSETPVSCVIVMGAADYVHGPRLDGEEFLSTPEDEQIYAALHRDVEIGRIGSLYWDVEELSTVSSSLRWARAQGKHCMHIPEYVPSRSHLRVVA